jgi:hypothetical protein
MTGGVLIHTTESIMDDVGPDTGAENVAAFIARRNEPGSYHAIVDADSTVFLMPDSFTAFHCEVSGFNSQTWSISFACRTTDLNVEHPWTQAAVARAATEIKDFWLRNGFNVLASATFVPAQATLQAAGLTTHGEAQPYNRSDAWTRHPQRPQLEAMLLQGILKGINPPTPEDDDMKPLEMWRDPATGSIWLFWTGPWRTGLKTQEDVKAYQTAGVPFRGDFPTTEFGAMKLRNTQWVKTG